MKVASAHKQVYKIFKKGVGHKLFLNRAMQQKSLETTGLTH